MLRSRLTCGSGPSQRLPGRRETRVEALLGRRFSRQALESHPEIYRADDQAKKRPRAGLPLAKRKPLKERIEVLQRENRKLRDENEALLERFVTWQLNAESHGLCTDQLNAPLPTARLPSDLRERELKRKEQRRAKLLADRDRRQARQLTRQ